MSKRWQFEEITVHPGNAIDLIKDIKNIADDSVGDYYFFITFSGSGADVMKSSDFASDDVSAIHVGGNYIVTKNNIVRRYGDNIYGSFGHRIDPDVGMFILLFRSLNDGVDWAVNSFIVPLLNGPSVNDDIRLIDNVEISGEEWYLYVIYDNAYHS